MILALKIFCYILCWQKSIWSHFLCSGLFYLEDIRWLMRQRVSSSPFCLCSPSLQSSFFWHFVVMTFPSLYKNSFDNGSNYLTVTSNVKTDYHFFLFFLLGKLSKRTLSYDVTSVFTSCCTILKATKSKILTINMQ